METIDSAVAHAAGAVDYVTKPFRIEELRSRLERAARAVELQQENHLLREQLRHPARLRRSHRCFRAYAARLQDHPKGSACTSIRFSSWGRAARARVVAKSVHFSGPRKDRPFVPVDCSSLVPTLIESELFGLREGCFTGALHGKQGLLEAANGGTRFSMKSATCPWICKPSCCARLQEREVKPVGSTERRHIDVRIIAATNRDLDLAIKAGNLPPGSIFPLERGADQTARTSERKSDIPLLVMSFLEKSPSRSKPRETFPKTPCAS